MFTTKNSLMIFVVFLVTAISLFAQPTQRRGGRIAEKIRNNRANQQNNNESYVVGKNRLTTVVDGDTREYFFHVPQNYNHSAKIPVVFMLHGTSGNGQKFYNISGWKELAETENILTVYPSSWRHCVIERGIRHTTTKWNIFPGSFEYCEGERPKDDIKFLNQVIDELRGKFNINQQMIYFVGFSNGGQMTARVGVEMSDRVAAVVSASGMFIGTATYTPKRLIPNLFQVGTDDDLFMPVLFGGKPAPMDFAQLFQISPGMNSVLQIYQRTYQLSSQYQTGGDPNSVISLEDYGTSRQKQNVFRFNLIKGMKHVYPNGRNFPFYGAREHWKWLKQFQLNDSAQNQ